MSYAELHCLSNYSFLRGASHPEELVCKAESLGYAALALTDECSVAGVVKAFSACKEHKLNLKLIVGSEFYVTEAQLLVLLCPSREAYAELCSVITLARRRCEKGAYRLSFSDIAELKHVLLLWKPSGAETRDEVFAQGIPKHFLKRSWVMYERMLDGPESTQGIAYRTLCCELSSRYALPVLCSGNVHMHTAERKPLQDVLTAIRLNTSVQDLGLRGFSNAENAMRPFSKLRKVYAEADIQQTLALAQRCHFDLLSLRYEYPKELVPNSFTAIRYLKHLVEKGMKHRFPNGVSLPIQATIRHELKLIEEQGYEYFFLTVYDIVQFAKTKGILYQGRGSAANSIVCYCLEITSVDPRQISVLFERFISKERNEPPDIDVDFEHQRREEIFQYIYAKYGRERAALAATVITFRFKSAFREVGKALGIAESKLDYYIKNVDRRDPEQAWDEQIKALGLNADNPAVRHLFSLTHEIIGFPRHLSQHVGGFVIASKTLSELVPVENASMPDRTVIQWDKNDLETLGLLKVDVLALGMLSAIRRSFDLIRHHYDCSLSIADISRLEDDPNVYGMLQKGDSVGVFQIESRAQMSMLPRLKPSTYYDLVVQIAIVRPGPIQGDMVHPYLRRRAGEEGVTYPSKEVQEVLARTLGVPIFQEQVIKLAMVAAGFSGGEADQLRRAMSSWKRSTSLQAFREKLVHGMLERGYAADFAERVYKQICGFGEYGFPESHAASFALLAYVSAWLKFYYPEAFYVGLLNSMPMGFYSPSQLIQDARQHQVVVRPICINASLVEHTLEAVMQGQNALRLGFSLVRGLSRSGAEKIVASRPGRGYQVMREVSTLGLNRSDLEALASANAFANISGHRFQARWDLLDSHHETPLFQGLHDNSEHCFNAPNPWQVLFEDYASMGLSLTQHPIRLLRESGVLEQDKKAEELAGLAHKSRVSVTGVVTGKQSPSTAGGVTFFTLEDETGNTNVVVWKNTARAQRQAYLNAKILRVTGILEIQSGVIHLIAGRLEDLGAHLGALQTKSREFH
jgi:error-prone DNA polymerase